MKLSQNYVRRFQEGGEMMPEEQGAPMGPEAGAPAGPEQPAGPEGPQGGNPEEQLQGIAQQLLDMLMQQIGDPQAVAAILQMALEMLSQGAQPQPAQFQRMGGRLVRVR